MRIKKTDNSDWFGLNKSFTWGTDNSSGADDPVSGSASGWISGSNYAYLTGVNRNASTSLSASGTFGSGTNSVTWGINNGSASETANGLFGASNSFSRAAGSGDITL